MQFVKRGSLALAALGLVAFGYNAPALAALSAGCAAVNGGALDGTGQAADITLAFNAGDVITVTKTGAYDSIQLTRGGVGTVATGATTATYTVPAAATFYLQRYLSWSGGSTTVSVTGTCVGGAEATTTTGNTVASNAKQSTQYIAPKVMSTATTAIGTLIGTNVKGAFSRVGGGVQGGNIGTGFAGAPAEVILADASGGVPRANADSAGGLRQGLLDGKVGGFAEMSYSHLRSKEAGGQYVGDVKNGVAGIDYKLRPDLLIGFAAGYEYSNFNTTYNQGWLDGQGLTLAPYLGYAFSNFVLDVTVGHSWLDYESMRGTGGVTYGKYDAQRNFVTSNLTATYGWQGLRLAPSMGLLLARETADAYIDSRNVQQGEATSQMGRASAGGEIGRPMDMTGVCVCSFEPFIKAKLNYDFRHNGRAVLANGQLSAVNEVTGQLGGGFRFGYGRFIALVIDSSYDTLGASDLEGWNVRGRVDFTLPF